MRLLKRVFFFLIAIVVVAISLAYLTGNTHILNGLPSTYFVGKSKPDIDDIGYFSVSTIRADKPEPLPMHGLLNQYTLTDSSERFAADLGTTAFILLKNDSVLLEKYWNDGAADRLSNSFSMAKTFTALLIGIAIEEGYILGVQQKAIDFIPELKGEFAKDLTIESLLQMTSGIPFGESYASPFGYMAKAYFGKDLLSETLEYQVTAAPGKGWIYEGGNTVLLGLILERATGRKVSDYFHQKVWSCIGAEKDAHWNLDKENGMEKTFSGFYATAKDFSRIGQLLLHNGVIGNDTLIQPEYMKKLSTPCMIKDVSPNNSSEMCYWYGYQTWLGTYRNQPFVSMRGMRGQYVVAFPESNLVMVRLGHEQNKERENHMPSDMIRWMDVAFEAANFAP